MSNKIAVNNEIVLMRKAVKVSKFVVKGKLKKEAKLLISRQHGDEKILEKCKRKGNKLKNELKMLKKIKDDDITKYAITNEKSLLEVLADTKADLKTRVLTRIAFHKILKARVEKFKEKFPDYQKYIGPGRKALAKIQRNSKNSEANSKNKDEDKQPDGENEKMDVDDNDNNNDDDYKVNSSDEEENESETEENESENEIDDDSDEDKDKKINKVKKDVDKKEAVSKIASVKRIKCDKDLDKVLNNVTVDAANKVKKDVDEKETVSKIAIVKRIKWDGDSDKIFDNVSVDTNINEEKIELDKEEDSFFVTANGQSSYQSIARPKIINTKEDEANEVNNYSRDNYNHNRNFFNTGDSKNNYFNRQNNRSENNYRDSSYNKEFTKQNNNKFEQSNDRRNNKFNNSNKDIKNNNQAIDEKLHPSWQAKKKQQDILKQGFQGKKIVFDD